jgi:hypothetical protein
LFEYAGLPVQAFGSGSLLARKESCVSVKTSVGYILGRVNHLQSLAIRGYSAQVLLSKSFETSSMNRKKYSYERIAK